MKKVDIKHKFFYYDEAEEPVMHVKSGDQIQFESEDCFQNLLTDESVVKSDLLKRELLSTLPMGRYMWMAQSQEIH